MNRLPTPYGQDIIRADADACHRQWMVPQVMQIIRNLSNACIEAGQKLGNH